MTSVTCIKLPIVCEIKYTMNNNDDYNLLQIIIEV